MGRTGLFQTIFIFAGFYVLFIEYVKVKLIWFIMGISYADHIGTAIESDSECMVRMFLSPVGPLNQILGTSTNWMTMPEAFRTIYIASGIWQGAGWASIMYTAALSNVSKELEEAAMLDGANVLQQIWYVQLPAIKNIIVIQFILSAGNIMSVGFEKAYALQTGMNLPTSEIISTYVYKIGLLNGDYGYSTAVGIFNSIINVILLLVVNGIVSKLNDGEGL